ncbi:MAG: FtsK/SpoIIIE domain-containing protein [Chloroflexota bacterium]|nr:FtsK/SpoIIIE domain-containing protein [Chloroflexota bacterium]
MWREHIQLNKEETALKQNYQTALKDAMGELDELDKVQRMIRCDLDPSPEGDLSVAGVNSNLVPGPPQLRLWERRPSDPDFLALRMGLGKQPTAVKIEMGYGEQPIDVIQRVDRYRFVDQVPFSVQLPNIGSLGIAGGEQMRIRLAHALLWHVVAHHAPSEVRIAALYAQSQPNWSWLRWTPHTVPISGDTHRRLLANKHEEIEHLLIELLDELSRRRERHLRDPQGNEALFEHVILLIDGDERLRRHRIVRDIIRYGRDHHMYVIILVDKVAQIPSECRGMVEVAERQQTTDDTCELGRFGFAGGEWSEWFTLDNITLRQSEDLGRALAGVMSSEGDGSRESLKSPRLLDLLGLSNIETSRLMYWSMPLSETWHPKVPIGQAGNGEAVYLDLREHHHGPHGIIAGATRAGKSDLLQTIIAAFAITHSPDQVQFLLIDYKAGAAFKVFKNLPHTVGLATDLHGNLAKRVITAIKSEIWRRKKLLDRVNVRDIGHYRRLEEKPETLANLLIVVDEYDEMAKEQPEFVRELTRVAKQGASLGIHLLLSTQQPSQSVPDQIKSQLQYWIALRLGTPVDSREMLQRPDAFFLSPSTPGRAYFRIGNNVTLFQAARVTMPHRPHSDQNDRLAIFQVDEVGNVRPTRVSDRSAENELVSVQGTDLDVIVKHLENIGAPYLTTRRIIWQDPLPQRLTLAQVLPSTVLATFDEQKWWSNVPKLRRNLLPIGKLDIPQESLQTSLAIDLDKGHLLVIGAPGSGKTMLLRTLLMSLALTERPSDIWCYLIDAGGQGLDPVRKMPHVGDLVPVREVERVRRLIRLVRHWLRERQTASRNGEVTDNGPALTEIQPLPKILLVIDKFALFNEAHKDLLDELVALARSGRQHGVHLIITADRPGDIPLKLLGFFESRLTLRLTDENDATMFTGERMAARIPIDLPGRGYQLDKERGLLEFQVALPYLEHEAAILDGSNDEETAGNLLDSQITADLRRLMTELNTAWRASSVSIQFTAPEVRLLEGEITFEKAWTTRDRMTSLDQADSADHLETLIGLESETIAQAFFQLGPSAPTILIVGDPHSGKTTALRTMLLSLTKRYQSHKLRLALIAPRSNSFLPFKSFPHVECYATTEGDVQAITARLATTLETKGDGEHWVICVDDYDVCVQQMPKQFTSNLYRDASEPKPLINVLEAISAFGADRNMSLIIATHLNNMPPSGLISRLDSHRNGLILRPSNFIQGMNVLGVRLPVDIPGGREFRGRGILVVKGLSFTVQVAHTTGHVINQTLEELPPHGTQRKTDD